MSTNHDKIAQVLALGIQNASVSFEFHDAAEKIADKMKLDFVLCITSDGRNLSKAFSVVEGASTLAVEDYFQNTCPSAVDCSFKFFVWSN